MLFGKRKGQKRDSLRGGGPLISAVDARKAPLSLTGTACGRLRSLPAREVSPSLQIPTPPQRALLEAKEDAPGSVLFGFVTSHKLGRADDAGPQLPVAESPVTVVCDFWG